MSFTTYAFPTDIHSGPGCIELLGKTLGLAKAFKPLLITDRDLADLPPVQTVGQLMGKAGCHVKVFKEIWGNPVQAQVNAGVEAYRKHACDSIVAVGGGAVLDVAKAVALMVHHPGSLFDYLDGDPKALPIDQAIPYTIAIPTTAGTGSEVGRSAVISDDTTKAKHVIFSPRLLPKTVFLDAELTLGLPAGVTAATGMDALTHLVEAYIAKGDHPMCEGIALEGIRLVAQHLERCVAFAKDPQCGTQEEHLEARDRMLNAAMMGAVAFQKGLGVTHSCAHALSTVCDLHHGLVNGILIPYTMSYNLAAVPVRFAVLAHVAGQEAMPEAFFRWLHELRRNIGIPHTLAEVGVTRDHIERLVEFANADQCKNNNPRPVSRDDLQAIFVQALGA